MEVSSWRVHRHASHPTLQRGNAPSPPKEEFGVETATPSSAAEYGALTGGGVEQGLLGGQALCDKLVHTRGERLDFVVVDKFAWQTQFFFF